MNKGTCKIWFTAALFFLLGTEAFGQQTFWGARGEVGFLWAHRSSMKHLIKGHTRAWEFFWERDADTSQTFSHAYNFPRFGIAGFVCNTGNTEQLGWGYALHPYASLPFLNQSGWRINGRMGVGLGLLTRKFEQHGNHKNIAIGSNFNGFIRLQVDASKTWNRFGVNASLALSHYSNGASAMPNLGLNFITLGGGLHYSLQENPKPKQLKTWNKPEKKTDLLIFAYGSFREKYPIGGRKYPALSISTFLDQHLSFKSSLEYGVEMFYNAVLPALKEQDGIEQKPTDGMQVGLCVGHSLHVDRFDAIFHVGTYAFNSYPKFGYVYNRIGARAYLTDQLIFNFSLKAHLGTADYFEWGLGYKL